MHAPLLQVSAVLGILRPRTRSCSSPEQKCSRDLDRRVMGEVVVVLTEFGCSRQIPLLQMSFSVKGFLSSQEDPEYRPHPLLVS